MRLCIPCLKVLVELFQKLAGCGAEPYVSAFLFVNFFFAPVVSKKKWQTVSQNEMADVISRKNFIKRAGYAIRIPCFFFISSQHLFLEREVLRVIFKKAVVPRQEFFKIYRCHVFFLIARISYR